MLSVLKLSWLIFSFLLGLLYLNACSDSGGGPAPASPALPANTAPAFTSAENVEAPEGATGAFYTAAAADPDGDSLSISVSGGADASLFSFDPTSNALNFVNAADFESPNDADLDGVYEIEFSATDGTATTSFLVRINLQDRFDLGIVQVEHAKSSAPTTLGDALASLNDLDGDGRDELVVSAPFVTATPGAIDDTQGQGGITFAVPGLELAQAETGRTTVLAGAGSPEHAEAVAIFGRNRPEPGAGDAAGRSIAVGELNGDDVEDLVIGASSADANGLSRGGRVYVLFGQPSSTPQNSSTLDLADLTAPDGVIIEGDVEATPLVGFPPVNEGIGLGGRVQTTGDVDGDGLADLLIGNEFFFDSLGGTPLKSTVFLVYGKTIRDNTTGTIDLSSLSVGEGVRFDDPDNTQGSFGARSVEFIRDIDGDGADEIIINNQNGDTPEFNAGKAYLIYSSALRDPAALTFDLSDLSGGRGFRIEGTTTGERVRISGAVGDLNLDGVPDIVVHRHEGVGVTRADYVSGVFLRSQNSSVLSTNVIIAEDSISVGASNKVDFGLPTIAGDGADLDGNGRDENLFIAHDTVTIDVAGVEIASLGDPTLYILMDGALDDVSSSFDFDMAPKDRVVRVRGFESTTTPWVFVNSAKFLGDLDGDGVADIAVGGESIAPLVISGAHVLEEFQSGDGVINVQELLAP